MQEDFAPKQQDMKSSAVPDADKALAQVAAALAQAQGTKPCKAPSAVHVQPTVSVAEQPAQDLPVSEAEIQEVPTPTEFEEAVPVLAVKEEQQAEEFLLDLSLVPEPSPVSEQAQTEESDEVLQKEISSAVPDRTVDMAKSVAKNVLQTDEVVRPFQQKDDKFRDFFTTSVVVLPKDMTDTVHTISIPATDEEQEKPSFFGRLRAFFARKDTSHEEDALFDQQEDDADILFPEEEALKQVFSTPMEAPEVSVSFSGEEVAAQTSAQTPRGKVRFIEPESDTDLSMAEQAADLFDFITAPQSIEDSASCKLADAMDEDASEADAADTDDFSLLMTEGDGQEAQSLEDSAACKLVEAMEEPSEPMLQDLFEPQSIEDSASCKLADAMDEDASEADAADTDDFSLLMMEEDGQEAQSLEDSAACKLAEAMEEPSEPMLQDLFEPQSIEDSASCKLADALEEDISEEDAADIKAFSLLMMQAEGKKAQSLEDSAPCKLAEAMEEMPVTRALGYGREEELAQEEDPTLGQSLREGLQAAKAGIAARCTALKTGWDAVNEQAAAEETEQECDLLADVQPLAQEQAEQAECAEHAEQTETAEVAATQVVQMAEPSTYCVFGEDDDETAALDQTGEISFEDTQSVPSHPSVFEPSVHTEAKKLAAEPLPEDADGIQFGLSGMRGKLLVRLFTTGVLSAGLLLLGLMAQGVVGAIPAIDPIAAPVPFLVVNLVLLLGAMGVCYPIFIEGGAGLWKKPSADTIPAIAGVAAFVQLLLCLMLVDQFEPSRITLCAAPAALVLFVSTLGNFIMSNVIQGNFDLATAGVPHHLAYKVQQKDVLHTLAQEMDLEHPDLLLSRPVQQMSGFLEKSFAPRASEQRAQWSAYALLGGATLAFLISLIKGQGFLGAISNMAVLLCIGAPLAISLLSALPSLFMHRAAARVGAMVPGWREVEVLGDTNLLTVDATDLFPPQCAQIHGIKTFQKERVDLAILYATSLLMHSGGTLKDLFAGMIEYNEKLLYPVNDFESRQGLGFVGWCENYRVIVGTRALMKAEGIALPVRDYEDRYSKKGRRQVLYLAVSGQLYAMFLIGYRGEKSIAESLRVLRREQIRLLVRCDDPTLTANRIEMAYHLPRGFVRLLSKEQISVYETATAQRPQAEGVMMHLGNFNSLVAGLKAAFAAAGAERAASAMMLISVAFSILLCLFLCIADGLMQVALVAILLYQIAWAVLTLGIILVKKFS